VRQQGEQIYGRTSLEYSSPLIHTNSWGEPLTDRNPQVTLAQRPFQPIPFTKGGNGIAIDKKSHWPFHRVCLAQL